jgi:hypothetical protein
MLRVCAAELGYRAAMPRLSFAVPVVVAVAAAAPAVPAGAYTRVPAPYRDSVHFDVRYRGDGHVATTYRSTPPNPGGRSDANAVSDGSTQRWALTYAGGLTVPACGGSPDPCGAVGDVRRATGATSATGRVRHRHVDGLYKNMDSAVSCRLRAHTRKGHSLAASVDVAYDPATQAFALTPGNPVVDVLSLLPGACPRQGDSLDLILDDYFTPGFSFDPTSTADRWFTPAPAVLPAAVLHASAKITIPVRLARAGTPPRHCAVRHPKYERCTTRGSWAGVLTLTATP